MAKKFNGEVFKKIYKEKGYTQKSLGEKIGVDGSTLSTWVSGKYQPKTPEVKLLSMILDVDEEEFYKATPKKEEKNESASTIYANDEILTDIKALRETVEQFQRDMATTAKMLININKVVAETKAQEELNREAIEALSNRMTDCTSNVARMYGKLFKKY